MTLTLLAAVRELGTFNGIGEFGNYSGNFFDTTKGLTNFSKMISIFLGFITILAGLWFILQMIMGGFNWLSSHGDKQGVENAKKRITHAIIGLFIVVVSYSIIGIVGMVLGFTNILDPFQSITDLW